MNDHQIREALTQHWTASDAGDFEMEHSIYHEDAILEYPQSAERIRGRNNIQMTRTLQPSRKRFTTQRILGSGDLWITEYILSYDGKPSYPSASWSFGTVRSHGKRSTSQIPSSPRRGAHPG